MGPTKGPSAKKQQQSISSFFTPKITNGVSAAPKKQEYPISQSIDEEPTGSPNIYDADSDDEEPRSRSRSAHSEKRPLVEDLDVVNNGGDRSSKRLKVDNGGSQLPPGRLPHRVGSHAGRTSATKKSIISPRTERYFYNEGSQSSAVLGSVSEDGTDNKVVQSQKEELHRKFVKKLGHPDSIAQIKRRNWQITEETE